MGSCLKVGREQQTLPHLHGANFSMWDHESVDQKDVGERRGNEKRRQNKEGEQRGRASWRNSRRDVCASEPTGGQNERLETWVKWKSVVQHLIMSLWRFLHGNMQGKKRDFFNLENQYHNISLHCSIIIPIIHSISLNFTVTILDLMSESWLSLQV